MKGFYRVIITRGGEVNFNMEYPSHESAQKVYDQQYNEYRTDPSVDVQLWIREA